MADIGDIHHPFNAISVIFQSALQEVFKEIRAEIAEMGIIINRRTAGIETDSARLDRDEFFFFPREGIV